jgi:L-2-hydroxyglutarate oxidase
LKSSAESAVSKSPSTPRAFDVAVIGGGIVGLATALRLLEARPELTLVLLEKEPRWAAHQSSRNSGVIHSGIYYRPDSMKAKLGRAGNSSMIAFCRTHSIPVNVCGKLIVATSESDLPGLEQLRQRAAANGVEATLMDGSEARTVEPNVRAVVALHVPSTAVTDFGAAAAVMARLVSERGGSLRQRCTVSAIRRTGSHYQIDTERTSFEARYLVACAGLESDRIARLEGVDPGIRIIPFRGEYHHIARAELVRALIYPVPDPDLPFLGVHLTRSVDGSLHAGPNAVLALAREGYTRTSISPRDLAGTLTYGGFWRMARRFIGPGWQEMMRSFNRGAFVRSVQRLVPEIRPEDFFPAPAGVRAQAVWSDGRLADDFVFVRGEASLHVCNAPSPAATASLEIGRTIAEEVRAMMDAS